MIFVFTAYFTFFFILFWNAERFNRMAEQKSSKKKKKHAIFQTDAPSKAF